MLTRAHEARAIGALFVAAVAWSLAVTSIGWTHAISDDNGWRQAQTAISAYFIQQGGPWFTYETPVLGPPWALPHEFPVYQVTVAAVSRVSGLALEQAGRFVSVAFFYASLAVAFAFFGELGIPRPRRLLILAIWMLSPLYLFWSRTFMIESTALFFAATFLTFTARSLSRLRWLEAAVAVAAGATAYAVKPPSLAGFVAIAGILWLVRIRQNPTAARVVLGAALLVLPIAIGGAWHAYGDSLKLKNPFGWAWTSAAIRGDWVLGPAGSNAGLDRRLEWGTWQFFWAETLKATLGHQAVLFGSLVCAFLARRRRLEVVALLVLAAAHFALFAPAYLGHPYYQYGSGLFLVVAVGLAANAALECGDRRRLLAGGLLALVSVACVSGYWGRMLPVQRRDAYRKGAWFVRLGAALAAATRPDDVIVGFGLDWNPEVPYYARRRALMWPGWADPAPGSKDVSTALAQLSASHVGALFNCSVETPEPTLERLRRAWRLEDAPTIEVPSQTRGRRCVVFTRAAAAATR
jgi:hypothetical protein